MLITIYTQAYSQKKPPNTKKPYPIFSQGSAVILFHLLYDQRQNVWWPAFDVHTVISLPQLFTAESRKHWKCTYLELLIKIYPDQSGCTLEYCNVEFFFFNAIHVDKN